MYQNLEAELARKRISKKNLAEKVGMKPGAVYARFAGRIPFSLEEAFRIRRLFDEDVTIEYLFDNSKQQ